MGVDDVLTKRKIMVPNGCTTTFKFAVSPANGSQSRRKLDRRSERTRPPNNHVRHRSVGGH
jgi:hypothetical protein